MRNNSNPKLLVSKAEATEKIQDRINIGKELLEVQISSEGDFTLLKRKTEKWTDYNTTLFKTLFDKSPLSSTHGFVLVALTGQSLYEEIADHKENISHWINDLESIYDQLGLYEETTQIREKLRYAKTKVITYKEKLKKDIPTHLKAIILGIIGSLIATAILTYIAC